MPNCPHGIDSRFCAICTRDTLDTQRQTVEFRAKAHKSQTPAQLEAYQAVYAYEMAMSQLKGRKTRASRTWPMIERHGVLAAVERIVTRKDETQGYKTLVAMGMEDMAFEAVVLRHSGAFSSEAVAASKARLERLRDS